MTPNELCHHCAQPLTDGLDLEAMRSQNPSDPVWHIACLLPFAESVLALDVEPQLELGPHLRRMLRAFAELMEEPDAKWLGNLEGRLVAVEDQAAAASRERAR